MAVVYYIRKNYGFENMPKKSSSRGKQRVETKVGRKIDRNATTGEFVTMTKSDRYIKETAQVYERVLTRLAKK